MDIAQLGFAVNTSGLEKGVKSIKTLESAEKSAGIEGVKSGGLISKSMGGVATSANVATSSMMGLKSILATVGGIALAGVGGGLTKSTIALGSELRNASKALNVNTEDLQAWSIAGESLGISMEKVRDIFKDTSDKMGDFIATGGGEAKDIFEKLNLDISTMRDLAPDKALLKIVEAMEKVENISQHEKIFLMEALANDASILLPLLKENGKELESVRQKAELRGLIISPQEMSILEQANSKLKESKMAISGIKHQLGLMGAELTLLGGAGLTNFFDSISSSLRSIDLTSFVLSAQLQFLIFKENAALAAKFVETQFRIMLVNLGLSHSEKFDTISKGWKNLSQSASANMSLVIDVYKNAATQIGAVWNREITLSEGFSSVKDETSAAFKQLIKDSELAQNASNALFLALKSGGKSASLDVKLIVSEIGQAWASLVKMTSTSSIETQQKEGWLSVENIASASFKVLTGLVETVWNGIVTTIRASLKIIEGDVDGAFALVETHAKDSFARLKEIFNIGDGSLIPEDLKTMGSDIAKGLTKMGLDILGAIRPVFKDIIDVTQDLRKTIFYHWDSITSVTSTIWRSIAFIVEKVWNLIIGTVRVALKIFRGDFSGAFEIIKSGFKNYAKDAAKFVLKIKDKFIQVSAQIIKVGKDIITNLTSGIKSLSSKAVKSVSDIAGDMLKSITNLPSKMLQAGKDMVDGLTKGIKGKASAAKNALVNVGKEAYSGFKNFWKIKSPSKLAEESGAFISEGIAIGIESGADNAVKSAETMSSDINNALSKAGKISAIQGEYDSFKAASDNRIAAARKALEAQLASRDAESKLTESINKTTVSLGRSGIAHSDDAKSKKKSTDAAKAAKKAIEELAAANKKVADSFVTARQKQEVLTLTMQKGEEAGRQLELRQMSIFKGVMLLTKARAKELQGIESSNLRSSKALQDAKNLIESVKTPLENLNDEKKRLNSLLKIEGVTQDHVNKGIAKAYADYNKAIDQAKKAKEAKKELTKIEREALELIKNSRTPREILNDKIEKANSLLGVQGVKQKDVNAAIKAARSEYDDTIKKIEKAKTAKKQLTDVEREALNLIKANRTPYEIMNQKIKKAEELLKAKLITQKDATRAAQAAREEYKKTNKEVQDKIKADKKAQDASKKVAATMKDLSHKVEYYKIKIKEGKKAAELFAIAYKEKVNPEQAKSIRLLRENGKELEDNDKLQAKFAKTISGLADKQRILNTELTKGKKAARIEQIMTSDKGLSVKAATKQYTAETVIESSQKEITRRKKVKDTIDASNKSLQLSNLLINKGSEAKRIQELINDGMIKKNAELVVLNEKNIVNNNKQIATRKAASDLVKSSNKDLMLANLLITEGTKAKEIQLLVDKGLNTTQAQAVIDNRNKGKSITNEVSLLKSSNDQLNLSNILLNKGSDAKRLQQLLDKGIRKESAELIIQREKGIKLNNEDISKRKKVKDAIDASNKSLALSNLLISKGSEAKRIQELINSGIHESEAKLIALNEKKIANNDKEIAKRKSIKDIIEKNNRELSIANLLIKEGTKAKEIQLLIDQGLNETQAIAAVNNKIKVDSINREVSLLKSSNEELNLSNILLNKGLEAKRLQQLLDEGISEKSAEIIMQREKTIELNNIDLNQKKKASDLLKESNRQLELARILNEQGAAAKRKQELVNDKIGEQTITEIMQNDKRIAQYTELTNRTKEWQDGLTNALLQGEEGLKSFFTTWIKKAAEAQFQMSLFGSDGKGGLVGTVASTGGIVGSIAGFLQNGYSNGGYTGNGGVNEAAGVVHGKEYVVNASATSKYRPMLETINNGGNVTAAESSGNKEVVVNYNPVINMQSDGSTDEQSLRKLLTEQMQQIPAIISKELNKGGANSRLAGMRS